MNGLRMCVRLRRWPMPAIVVAALVVFLFTPCVNAQAVAVASLSGRVADVSSAVIAGAEVRATQTETHLTRSTNTDPQGNYSLSNLPVGPYVLEVKADGFKTYVQSGIVLQVGNNVEMNVTMQIGAVTDSIEVSAGAAMVETKNNSVAQVIDRQRIVDLPLNGRDATQLILVSGAAVTAPGGGPNDLGGSKSFYSSKTISIAGGQANAANYLLDGGDNNDFFSNVNLPFPFPEALQEFSVETSSLPARNGLHPGGVVNAVTKSGTNVLHGDLFEYLRNGGVNARNFFLPTHDNLRRNQFGGDAGGKILKDRMFFFGGYQGTRIRTVIVPGGPAYVPTDAMLHGDFSARASAACQAKGAITVKDPLTNQPFPSNLVPTSRFNSASVKLLNYIPVASDQCGKLTYTVPNPSTEDQAIGRIDYIPSSRHTVFGRYLFTNYKAPAPFDDKNLIVTSQVPGNWQRAQTVTLSDTFTIDANRVNSLHATFSRRRNDRGGDPNMINPTMLGISMFVAVPNDMRIQMTNNGFGIGCGTCSPGHFNINTYQLADDLDIIHGRHQIALGVDLIRSHQNSFAGYLQNGNFTFSNTIVGDTLAAYMLGVLDSSAFAFGQSRGQPTAMRGWYPGLYAQDNFKISQRVSLNFGLRWEPMIFPADYFGRGSTFRMDDLAGNRQSTVYVNAPAGMFYYGDPGVRKSFTDNKITNFSPRLGLVWSRRPDGKETIRVGAAMLYDAPMLYFPQRIMSNPPFVNEIDLLPANTGPFNDPWSKYPGGNPFPGVTPPPKNAVFPTSAFYAIIPDNLKTPYTTNWNVTYQRQVAGNWLASASYIGSKTSHLWISFDYNSPINIPGATAANEQNRRRMSLINPSAGAYIGQMAYADDGANATYNGMLLSLQHRFSAGFTALMNYTWSHCISDGDFSGDLRNAIYQNQFDRRGDRGDCNFDVRQMFNASFVFKSPVTGKGIAGKLLANWQLAPLVRKATNIPLNIASGKDNSLTGEGTDRPNYNPGVPVYNENWGANLQYLNPAAFTANPTGTFGNVGRNTARYPGIFNFDLSLTRTFALKERLNLEARAEGFNIVNHANFTAFTNYAYGGLAGSISATNFGQLTTAADPRILQFALKLHF